MIIVIAYFLIGFISGSLNAKLAKDDSRAFFMACLFLWPILGCLIVVVMIIGSLGDLVKWWTKKLAGTADKA